MLRRHPLPRLWLMTDERMGEALWDALERLPRGSGVIFRDYSRAPDERRRRFARTLRVARRRRLLLLRAGDAPMRGEMGTHNVRGRGIRTQAVHDIAQLRSAERARVDAVLVSPVFATRSHPGARPLGVVRLGLLIRGARLPVIALGGMSAAGARRLAGLPIRGWAAIDGWTRDQPVR